MKKHVLLGMFTVLISSLFINVYAEVTSGRTSLATIKKCPAEYSASFSLRFENGFKDVEQAVSYGDTVKASIKALLEENGIKDATFSNSGINVSKREERKWGEVETYWRSSGNVGFTINEEGAVSILKALDVQGYKNIDYRTSTKTPVKCD